MRMAGAAVVFGLFASGATLAAKPAVKPPSNSDCLTCHADAGARRSNGKSVAVAPKRFDASVHGQAGVACVDCHADLASTSEFPHKDRLKAVDCSSCHDKAGAAHPFHPEIALNAANPSKSTVACADCHGSHEITGVKDPAFRFTAARQPEACGSCHDDVKTHFAASEHGKALASGVQPSPACLSCHKNPVTSGAGLEPAALKRAQERLCLSCHVRNKSVVSRMSANPSFISAYEQSVHGVALLRGNAKAPTCVDCHGAHDEQKGFSTASLVNKMRVQQVCARCHPAEEHAFAGSVHGAAVRKGNQDAPACTDCHGEHSILSPKNPRSPVAAANVSAAVCTPCHGSLALAQKWDLPRDRSQTFADSYHGLAARGGSLTVANCASCHGSHDILPSRNPASRVHRANLAATCGAAGCHPGANARFGAGRVHLSSTQTESPIVYWIATLYVLLIVLVVGGMFGHNALDFVRKGAHQLKVRRGEIVEAPPGRALYLRMTASERLQHAALTVSFTLLVVTGFMLRYPEATWVAGIRHLSSRAFEYRSLLHRISAVVMVIASLAHVGYIAFTARGRQLVRDLWWRPKDLRDAIGLLKYNLGISSQKPKLDRFSYIEKSEYWALVWGTVVMAVTGMVMWFDNTFIGLFGKLGYDVSRTIHFYEAWLATLAILVWHFYWVMLNPETYPMNMSWLTGKLSEKEMEEEHPLELERIRDIRAQPVKEPVQ
ncbi:MAG TPA: cytochrome c3 family protein [Thermoanaerobaculia bacterium]|nr:cytochrome c3 family protein [Thermoanaerobaculia bacterium]